MKNDSLPVCIPFSMSMIGGFGVTYNLAKYMYTGHMTRLSRLGLAGSTVSLVSSFFVLKDKR